MPALNTENGARAARIERVMALFRRLARPDGWSSADADEFMAVAALLTRLPPAEMAVVAACTAAEFDAATRQRVMGQIADVFAAADVLNGQ